MTQTQPFDAPELWLLCQVADSAFPVGGFAHSGGVEAAWQHGHIPSPQSLHQFVTQALQQTLHASIPFLLAAFDQSQPLEQLDALLDATLTNHVANRASRAQGHAFLATSEKTFHIPLLTAWRAQLLKTHQPAHFVLVVAVVLRSLGVSRKNALRLFLFLTMRGILSAAVRLGAAGPILAQQLQATLAKELEDLVALAEHLTLADVAQTSPFLEILQSTQDRLYSRLFQS